MELMQYVDVVRKWIWLIVLSTVLAAGTSLVASWLTTPVYKTSTTLMVSQTIQDPNPSSGDIYASQQLAQTYVQLARREPILRATVETLGLKQSWESLRNQVSAVPVQGTQLIEISVLDTSPARAQAIANEIARQLILQSPTTPSPERQARIAFIQSQLPLLEERIRQAQQEVLNLGEQISVSNSARQIQDLSQQQSFLNSQITQWQTTYTQMLEALNQGTLNYLSVVETASLPARPISPNIPLNVGLAAIIGLALALGGAFLMEYLDDTVRSPEEAQKLIGVPALTVISKIEGESKLIALTEPRSPITEAYRELRTNLQFSALDLPLKTILVTSASPGEGKSITAANLAIVMAQGGYSVLLVDADLRRPVLHKLFNLNNGRGLTTWLVGSETRLNELPGLGSGWMQNSGALSEDLKTFSQATRIAGLRVITSGGLPPNPSEVLGSERMRQFLNEAQHAFDVVIIDSPPCGAVTDPVVLSQVVDGVLLVLDAHSTVRQAARRASENLRNVNARLVGMVINRLDRSKGRYYYYSRYYSSYYYSDSDQEQGQGRASKNNGHKNGRRIGWGRKPAQQSEQTDDAALEENKAVD